MADPHHVERLDGFDRATVLAYRAGIAAAALGTGALALAHLRGADDAAARVLVVLALALLGAHLHLYAKRVRWTIVASAWLGALLLFAGEVLANGWVGDAGLGFAFVAFSGVALKERFCFKIPLVRLVPMALAAALLPLRLGAEVAAAGLLAAGALLLGLLAVAKARMPLHYDVGDRSKYEV